METKDFGVIIHPVGSIYRGGDIDYLLYFPNHLPIVDKDGLFHFSTNEPSVSKWQEIIRQLDLVETEIFTKDDRGKIVKTMIRKSQRQIAQNVMWAVFKRDNYTCQYCGTTDGPLTVDHLILWEEGGPTIESNLLTSCKKCNNTRGNMQFKDWINSDYYKNKAPLEFIEKHLVILEELDGIPRYVNQKKKRS